MAGLALFRRGRVQIPARITTGKEQAQEHHPGEPARSAEPIGLKNPKRLSFSHASFPHARACLTGDSLTDLRRG
jgi:hypothetical protein